MKLLNKKFVISSLSALMSVGLVGSIAGTLAWYQYNTRATTTVLGTSVANTGVLQISKDHINWTRDLVTADLIGSRAGGSLITPVTFGKMNLDGSLPGDAYKRPDASENPYGANPGKYEQVYQVADAEHDYIQYSVYLRAMVNDNVAGGQQKASLPVFLSDIMLKDVDTGEISEGLRVHLAIDEDADDTDDKFYLISKDKVENLALFGKLDLDGDEKADIVGGYESNPNHNEVVMYGNKGEFQTTLGINEVKATRNGNGDYDLWDFDTRDKVLFYTPGVSDAHDYVKVTVTFWFEGWDISVDDMQIDAREIEYREVKGLHAESVDGLYVLDAGDYVEANGKAVDGTNYFELYYKEVELEEFAAIPANTYSFDGANYSLIATPATAVSGEHYYERIVRDVTAKVVFAQSVDGLYTKDGSGNYILIDDPAAKAVDGTDYFEKLSVGEQYDAVILEDGLGNPLPAGAVSVDGLYTRDLAGNYIKASGMNALGETYYELTDAGKINVPIWSGENTDGAEFRFGLTFDVGKNAFNS